MSAATKKMAVPKVDRSTQIRELEDQTKGEVTELLLLLKSGALSDQEKASIEDRLKQMILGIEIEQKRACCG